MYVSMYVCMNVYTTNALVLCTKGTNNTGSMYVCMYVCMYIRNIKATTGRSDCLANRITKSHTHASAEAFLVWGNYFVNIITKSHTHASPSVFFGSDRNMAGEGEATARRMQLWHWHTHTRYVMHTTWQERERQLLGEQNHERDACILRLLEKERKLDLVTISLCK